jgi:hypothetical protein
MPMMAPFTMTTKNGHTGGAGRRGGAVIVTLPRAGCGRAG